MHCKIANLQKQWRFYAPINLNIDFFYYKLKARVFDQSKCEALNLSKQKKQGKV